MLKRSATVVSAEHLATELPVTAGTSPWRMCVAPMLDWTDRHCRYFHRLLSAHARLYTEMVTTGALLHGDAARHLRFHPEEQPLALQLGGSDPADLAKCARLAQQWGYAEVNLNCGCPSERVQKGAFGACLMREPHLVAECVRAMVDVVQLPVTVKHRIGVDQLEDYGFVRDFVGIVSQAGCQTFVAHARSAWLKGLSPKENRQIPPLRYEQVYQLKQDFAHLQIVINGGVTSTQEVHAHLQHVDGVMVGREAYHNPWWLSQWDAEFFPGLLKRRACATPLTRDEVERLMVSYMERQAGELATPWPAVARHMLGLRAGTPGARHWRRVWSDSRLRAMPAADVMALAAPGAVALGTAAS